MKNARIYSAFAVTLGGILVTFCGPLTGQDTQRVDLTPSNTTSAIYRVTSRMDGRGVVTPAPEKTMRLRLDARFRYDERIIARKLRLKSVRDYDIARAEIRLGDGSIVNELSEQRRILIVQSSGDSRPLKMAAIDGSLTQKELELVNVPANTLILSELVSKKKARPGDSWRPQTDTLTQLLNVHAIEQSNVEITFEKMDRGLARIFVRGEINGRVDDASTQITISGVMLFDVDAGYIRSSEITLNQQRDISRLAPGLDATFKISTRLDPVESSKHLTNEGLAELRKNAENLTEKLVMTSPDKSFRLTHSRAWRVIGEQKDRSILRLIDRGQMLGQCDVISLPPRPEDDQQSLQHFREVVEARLADQNATITGTDQSSSDSEPTWMRVTATGAADGVRLTWNYYTISQSDGQRVQLVFTTGPEQAIAFERQFESLISGIEFFPASPARNAGYQTQEH